MRKGLTPRIVLGTVLFSLAVVPPASAQEQAFASAAQEVAEKIAAAFPKVEGLILDIQKNRVFLDVGTKEKAYGGMELEAYREGAEFRHPFTGQVLGRMDKTLGRLRIVEVQPNFSVAEVVSTAEGVALMKGDKVRMTAARLLVALPNVDTTEIKGGTGRTVTRDLSLALIRTGRFEVIEDRRLRAAISSEKLENPENFTDPEVLRVLVDKLKISAVLLGKVSVLEKGLMLDVQVVSPYSGGSLLLASAEIKSVAPPVTGAAPAPTLPVEVPRGMGRRTQEVISRALSLQAYGPFLGPEFSARITAMAVGDFQGTGRPQVALSDGRQISIFTLDRGRFRQVWESVDARDNNIIGLDAVDVKGSGRAGLFVTNYFDNRIRSYALEFQGKDMVRAWNEAPYFFRALPTGPEGTMRLYGQRQGTQLPFSGPIREIQWQKGSYVEGPALDIPTRFSIYGLAVGDLDGMGNRKILAVTDSDYLSVYNLTGDKLFQSPEHLGGSDLTIRFVPLGEVVTSGNDPTKNIPIEGRILIRKRPDAPGNQIIVWKNTPATFYFLKESRYYNKGKIISFWWTGRDLQPLWETNDTNGYIADYALADIDGDGAPWLILAVVEQREILNRRSSVIAYKLSFGSPSQ